MRRGPVWWAVQLTLLVVYGSAAVTFAAVTWRLWTEVVFDDWRAASLACVLATLMSVELTCWRLSVVVRETLRRVEGP